jgi:putative endonuclease
MYIVYILKDENGKIYKGMTNNLERRLKEHRSGQTITTSRMANFSVVYTEEFDKIEDARKRELYFKSAAGRRFLKDKIEGL